MRTVSTNLRRLYAADRAKTDQPYLPLDVEFLQGGLPEVDEAVILEDGNLRIGVQARVIEHLEGRKVNVLVPMRDIYSLDPNTGAPGEDSGSPYFYGPSYSSNVAGDERYGSFGYPQATPSVQPQSDVKIVKSFSAAALLALLLSSLCLYFFFFWEEYVAMFLVVNSPLEGLLYFAADEIWNVDLIKFTSWAIVLSPFLAVFLCWRHWSADGDGVTGLLGSLASSLAAGFSSVLLLAVMAIRGWFGDFSSSSAPPSGYGSAEGLVFSDSFGLVLWLFISGVWFLVTITGMGAKK